MTESESEENESEGEGGIVIHNASYEMQAGFVGDDAPRSVFKSLIARKTCPHYHIGMNMKDCYIGFQAEEKQRLYCYTGCQPIQNGIIKDWNGIENIWKCIFDDELRVDPKQTESGVLMLHSSLTSRQAKKKMMEIMFEKFEVPKYYSISQEATALYSTGRLSGLVLNIGHDIVSAVPVIDSATMLHAVETSKIAGNSSKERWVLPDIKHKLCYVAMDYGIEMDIAETSSKLEKQYDGHYDQDGWIFNSERFTTGEIFFRNAIVDDTLTIKLNALQERLLIGGYIRRFYNDIVYEDIDGLLTEFVGGNIEMEHGIHKLVEKAIMNCNLNGIIKHLSGINTWWEAPPCSSQSTKELRDTLWSNVVMIGGSSMYPGMSERLQKELKSLISSNPEIIKIIAPPERKYSEWIGGSMLASTATFDQIWVTRKEYDEYGEAMIDKKCGY